MITRRAFLRGCVGAGVGSLLPNVALAAEDPFDIVLGLKNGHPGYFSPKEMALFYEQLYRSPKRLNHHFIRQGRAVLAPLQESFLTVPPSFLERTLSHLEQALEKGYARHIFFSDLGHGHFFHSAATMPKLMPLSYPVAMTHLMHDSQIGIIYHAAENLEDVKDPKTGRLRPDVWERRRTRNILGWYDGRPIEVNPPEPSFLTGKDTINNAHGPGQRYGALDCSANQQGEFEIRPKGERIRLDLSFEA